MGLEMQVAKHDPPWVWLVTSTSRPDVQHLVDLQALGANGECSCEHFQYTLRSRYLSTLMPQRCKHIQLVREVALNYLLRISLENERVTQS